MTLHLEGEVLELGRTLLDFQWRGIKVRDLFGARRSLSGNLKLYHREEGPDLANPWAVAGKYFDPHGVSLKTRRSNIASLKKLEDLTSLHPYCSMATMSSSFHLEGAELSCHHKPCRFSGPMSLIPGLLQAPQSEACEGLSCPWEAHHP